MIDFNSNSIVKSEKGRDFLAVVILTYNRSERLLPLVNSLVSSIGKSSENIRVIFCINGPDRTSENFLTERQNLFSAFDIVKLNHPVTPAEARNIAVQQVNSEWILFLDDDTETPDELFVNFFALERENKSISLWGGPNLTPAGSPEVQHKMGWLLQNPLVTGPIAFRYRKGGNSVRRASEIHLSLCNIFIKTSVFKRYWFNGAMKIAEENELLHRLAADQVTMRSTDLLFIWHYRRNSFDLFFAQIRNYGFGRGQLLYKKMVPSHLKPAAVLAAVAAAALMIVNPVYFVFSAAVFYLLICFQMVVAGLKMYSFDDFILPLKLWYNYGIGIYNGYLASYQEQKKVKRLETV